MLISSERIHLSVDKNFYDILIEESNRKNCTVNVFVISLLEQIYLQNPFDYEAALKVLEKEAVEQPAGEEFTLADLPSFSEVCIARARDAKLKPSEVRARLGKIFNARVRENRVGDVERRRNDDNGELVFKSRAAVYRRKPADKETDC